MIFFEKVEMLLRVLVIVVVCMLLMLLLIIYQRKHQTSLVRMSTRMSGGSSPAVNQLRFDSCWYTAENPFYYLLCDNNTEQYRTRTELRIGKTRVTLIGESHAGPTRICDFDHYRKPLTVLMEAGNKIFKKSKSEVGLWLREPYFAYWYRPFADEMYDLPLKNLVKNSVKYSDNFTFVPYDYRESVMDCPLFRPWFAVVWLACATDSDRSTQKWLDRIPDYCRPTLEEVKASGYYNPKQPNEYYPRVLDKYSYDFREELIMKIQELPKMSFYEFFDDITFGSRDEEIDQRVKDYFSAAHGKSLISYYDSVCDIFAMNELVRHLDDKHILIYGGAAHTKRYLDFIYHTFRDDLQLERQRDLNKVFEQLTDE